MGNASERGVQNHFFPGLKTEYDALLDIAASHPNLVDPNSLTLKVKPADTLLGQGLSPYDIAVLRHVRDSDPLYYKTLEEQRSGVSDPNKRSDRYRQQIAGAALMGFGLIAAGCGEVSGAVPTEKEPPSTPAYVQKTSVPDYGFTTDLPSTSPSVLQTGTPGPEQTIQVKSVLEQLLPAEKITGDKVNLLGVKYDVVKLEAQTGGGEGKAFDSAPTNFVQPIKTINGEAFISGLSVDKEGESAALMMPVAIWNVATEEWQALNSGLDLYKTNANVTLREAPQNGLGGKFKGSLNAGETIAKVPGSETYKRIYINGGYYDVVVIFNPNGTVGLDEKGKAFLENGIAYVASDFLNFEEAALQVEVTQEVEALSFPTATPPSPSATATPESRQTSQVPVEKKQENPLGLTPSEFTEKDFKGGVGAKFIAGGSLFGEEEMRTFENRVYSLPDGARALFSPAVFQAFEDQGKKPEEISALLSEGWVKAIDKARKGEKLQKENFIMLLPDGEVLIIDEKENVEYGFTYKEAATYYPKPDQNSRTWKYDSNRGWEYAWDDTYGLVQIDTKLGLIMKQISNSKVPAGRGTLENDNKIDVSKYPVDLDPKMRKLQEEFAQKDWDRLPIEEKKRMILAWWDSLANKGKITGFSEEQMTILREDITLLAYVRATHEFGEPGKPRTFDDGVTEVRYPYPPDDPQKRLIPFMRSIKHNLGKGNFADLETLGAKIDTNDSSYYNSKHAMPIGVVITLSKEAYTNQMVLNYPRVKKEAEYRDRLAACIVLWIYSDWEKAKLPIMSDPEVVKMIAWVKESTAVPFFQEAKDYL